MTVTSLITADPRTIQPNPNNPRKVSPSAEADRVLVASIKSLGIIQPPVIAKHGDDLVLVAGHRRVAAAIAAGLEQIPCILVADDGTATNDLRAYSENTVRAEMNPVDQWRAIERLLTEGWNQSGIALALGLTERQLRQLQKLGKIHPDILMHMAINMPDQRWLAIIANAPHDEQIKAWKQHGAKKGREVYWPQIASALDKKKLFAKDARFGDDLAAKHGIVWQEDLFAPAKEDSRSTTNIKGFMDAQQEWLQANLPKGGSLAAFDQNYNTAKLPKGAIQHYRQPKKGDLTVGLTPVGDPTSQRELGAG
jgi:ParB family transcriptional regulator, chromosome partitioning protein